MEVRIIGLVSQHSKTNINNIVCPQTNEVLSNPLEISETLADYQKSKVQFYDPSNDMQRADNNMVDNSPLLSVLNKHNVSLADFSPPLTTPPTHVNSSEIQAAISSFKSRSAPGPSGQGKKFFEFLFRFNRTFFNNAINRLINVEDFEKSKFAWIKNRTIIFIKKSQKVKPINVLILDQFPCWKFSTKFSLNSCLKNLTRL